MTSDSPLVARPIPSGDRVFTRIVEAAATDAQSPEDLEQRLRPLFPRATVTERGLAGEPRIVYVYRDGHFTTDSDEPWWEQPDVARVTLDAETGVMTAVNERWAELMGEPPGKLTGRPYTDFVLPEALPTAQALLGSILELGEARSSVVLRRPDGRLITIEFRAVLDGRLLRVAYRPVPAPD
jgi:PAS domain-containing protein